MGKSTIPRYVIKSSAGIIYTGNRRPNVEREVMQYIDSMKIGGVNEHLSKAIGYMPIPSSATLIDQIARAVVEVWHAPAFMEI